MTKLRLLTLLAVLAFVGALLVPALALAQPAPPCRIHGTAQIDGVNVAVGTVITATIDGDTYTATTPSAYGASTYLVSITQPDGKSYAGKTVTFKIGADTALETATWEQGGNLVLNLTKGVAPTPTPPPGAITSVVANPLPAGSTPTASLEGGVLTLGIPAGAAGAAGTAGAAGAAGAAGSKGDTGAAGAAGAAGDQGEAGDDASAALGIIGLIVAIVALLAVGYVLIIRKPKAA